MNPLTWEINQSVSFIELLYTLGGIYGALHALHWLGQSNIARDDLIQNGLNGGRLIATRINITVGQCMSVKMLLYVIVGINAMTFPPLGGTGDVQPQSALSGLCFLMMEAIAVWMMQHMNTLYDLGIRYFIKLEEKNAEAFKELQDVSKVALDEAHHELTQEREGNDAARRMDAMDRRMDNAESETRGHSGQQGAINPQDHPDRHTEQERP